jgi:hypothetical protein
MFGLGSLMGGKNGRSQDNSFANIGEVPMNDKEQSIKSSAMPISVKGDRRETGPESYIEIKGPTGLGAKSSTPYTKVLPKYKKQAEQAVQRQQIPREHQKRVKEYFESLERGG